MRGERERLLDEIIEEQRRILRATQAASTPDWIELQLTMAQLKALFVLASEPRSVGEVGEALGTGRAAASLLIERLVQVGVVERTEDQTDRRRTLVHLTALGEQSVARLREGGRERYRAWLGRLSDEELSGLARGLRALASVAENDTRELKDGSTTNSAAG